MEGDQPFVQPPDAPLNLGDIAISIETARRQADERHQTLTRELAFLAIHGTLHLLGYDHQTDEEEAEMDGLANQAMKALGL
jgi:probable rRNA maturation factor